MTSVRFFSEKVFGVWVEGTIIRRTKKSVTLEANFHGHRWTERLPATREFYHPSGHPNQGEPFFLTPEAARD